MSSKKPLYISIAEQFKTFIKKGVYKLGDKIPSVREYAIATMVNPNTVAKAYDLLKEEGIVESIPQKGIYIVKGKEEDNRSFVLSNKLKELHALNYKKEEIMRMVEQLWK